MVQTFRETDQNPLNVHFHDAPIFRSQLLLIFCVQRHLSSTSIQFTHPLRITQSRASFACTRAAHIQQARSDTPTIPNFREEHFRDPKSNHEIYENIVPQKFGAI